MSDITINYRRLPSLRESQDVGANSAALPMLMIASLVGFGAVIAALPAFAMVRDMVFSIQGGAAALDYCRHERARRADRHGFRRHGDRPQAFGDNFMQLAATYGIDPSLMHRVTTISSGTLDALPTNGTVLLLLKISGQTHRDSYFDMVMTVIVSVIIG